MGLNHFLVQLIFGASIFAPKVSSVVQSRIGAVTFYEISSSSARTYALCCCSITVASPGSGPPAEAVPPVAARAPLGGAPRAGIKNAPPVEIVTSTFETT
jgi:hypothetical protein